MREKEKLYEVWCYPILDATARPVLVWPARQVSAHATLAAAERAAKQQADGGLLGGPKNVVEVRSRGVVHGRLWALTTGSVGFRGGALSVKPVLCPHPVEVTQQTPVYVRWHVRLPGAEARPRRDGPFTPEGAERHRAWLAERIVEGVVYVEESP